VTPVTVSVDTPDAEAKTKVIAIPFPVLSDSDATMIEAFHVVNKVDPDTLAKMRGSVSTSSDPPAKPTTRLPSLALLIDRTEPCAGALRPRLQGEA